MPDTGLELIKINAIGTIHAVELIYYISHISLGTSHYSTLRGKKKEIVQFDKIAPPLLPHQYKKGTSSEAREKFPPTITCPTAYVPR